MRSVLIAGSVAALVSLTAPAAHAEATVQNPLLAPWTGPYGGVPPFDKVKVERLQARAARRRWRSSWPRSTRSPAIPRRPTFENTIAALERAGPHARPRERHLRHLQLDDEHARLPGGRAARWRRSSPPSATRSRRTRSSSRASPPSTRRARSGTLTPEQKRLVWLDYTNFVRAGAKLDAAAKKRRRRDQPAAGHALHEVQPERARRRDRLRARAREGGRPRRPARLRCAPAAAAAAEQRGQQGQVGHPEHALERGAVPHLLRPARPAREGLAHVLQPRRQRRRARQQGDHHRDPEAARRARASCSATRRTRTGASRTPWRRRPSAAMELMEAVWKPAVARVHEEVADMQAVADKEGAKHQDRALGLPLLRREGAQGEVRPRRERGEAVPAAREAARGHVLGGRPALRLRSSRRSTDVPVYQPGRPRLRGDGRDGQARRPLVLRSLRAPRQALGRVDERVPQAGALRRRGHDRSSPTTRTS